MLRMMLKDLRIAPMRTVLMTLSVFIGIAAVLASVLAGTIGNAYLIGINNQRYGRSPHFIASMHLENSSQAQRMGKLYEQMHRMNKQSAITARAQKGVIYCPIDKHDTFVQEQQPSSLTHCTNMETVYATSGYSSIFTMPMKRGTWYRDDAKHAKMQLVVNAAAAQKFPLGSQVMLIGQYQPMPIVMQVVGIVSDGNTLPKTYVSVLPLARFAWQTMRFDSLTILWYEQYGRKDASVRSILQDACMDTFSRMPDNISISRDAEAYAGVIAALQIGFGLCAVLLLFVASLGLMSIGLATLEQRSHELLIRRALGATRLSTAVLVLGSSLSIVLMASILAIAISYAVVLALPYMFPPDLPISFPTYPYVAAIAAIAAALCTSLIGGLIPAIQASRLQPALVLR